ncbi:uncharacterized protein LOC116295477 isoform X3 [Actinia tenebrosa]|uniref:Uncharacterized protein LOC116295477 isoform X3 n=1 Tax=Actinia tenebrosa TaxID=6105 RepID=A0A6P8HUV5_ACTTE|nr:uncharacterized protein LOC116295477 isoform X3 [Actinia tenebrosa]
MASRIIFSIFLGIAFTYVVQAQLVVPGKCPDFPAPAECPPEPDDECRNDVNCAELYPGQGLKCCKDGCDKVCTLTEIRPRILLLIPGSLGLTS